MARFKQTCLTPQLHQQIVAAVRAGGYPHLAAQAFGVRTSVLKDWLRRGIKDHAREPYRSFARAVTEAHAQARLKAEVAVLQDDPKWWLEHGPGRERAAKPGWSTAVKAAEKTAARRDVLHDPEILALLHLIVDALQPFPEARRAVAAVLLQQGVRMAA
jgi:hypothetical protein